MLRSLIRQWQPKVTSISKKKSLYKITLIALFEKLQEHELHVECLKLSRQCSKQKKIILCLALKANTMIIELDKVKDSTCTNFKYLEIKIVDLNQVIMRYEKS